MLKFWTNYETAKFTRDQSDWLGKLEWGVFEQDNQLRICNPQDFKFVRNVYVL